MSNALIPRPDNEEGIDDTIVPDAAKQPRPGSLRDTVRQARDIGEIRRSPYGLRPILVIAWVGLFLELNGTVGGVAFRQIIRDVDMDFAGFIRYSQFVNFVAIFAVIGIAYYADRRNRIRMVGVGILLGGFFLGLTATAQSGLSFGVPNLLAAAFLITATFPVNSLIADYYPVEVRGRVYALSTLFSAATSTLIPLFAGYTVDAVGWRPVYGITALPVSLIGLLVLFRLREPIRGYMERRAMGAPEDVAVVADEPVSLGEAWRTVFAIRTLRRLFIAGLISAPAAALFGFLSTQYLFERYGLSERQIGQVQAIGAVFVLPAIFLSGGLVDSLIKRRPESVLRLFGIVNLIGVIPSLLYALGLPIPVLVISSGLFAFVAALVGPATAVLYAQIVPANMRNVGQAVRGMAALSAPIGGFFIGTVQQSYGLRGGLLFCLPFFVISGLVFLSSAPLFELDLRAAVASSLANEEYRRAKETGLGKLLVCRGVEVQYSGVQVLFGVDFDVEDGEIVALLGTNGAGKSTLLRAIAGLTTASGGAIVLDGRDITFMPPHETAARGVIFMPGGRGIFPGLTVRENLLLGTFLSTSAEETRERLQDVFRIFPILAERAESVAGTLSGGEQQQLSLAQAFLCKPRLLMIDELSLGLSPAVVGQLIEVVRRIHETGVTVIVVEQSVNVALTLAEKAIFMEKGEVKFFGRTEDLMNRPDILRAVYVKGTGGASVAGSSRQRMYELEQARPVLEVQGITKRFGGITALDDVSFALREGEVLGLVGPNGSGKTTLFDLISGYQVPDAGHVLYEGVDITSLRPDQRAERRLIRRFQDAKLFPSLTVYESLLVSLDQRVEVKGALSNAIGLPRARRSERRVRARADALIDLLDLGAYRDKFVKELSTGLRRIVDIACVLANDPRVLMLDEPSSGIAQAEAEGLAPLLRRVKFETGCSILIIEHDMPLISAVSDELLALDRGRVVMRGLPDEVLNDDRVVESYLGGTEAAIRRSGSLTS